MVVTATELKANIGYYLNAVSEDEVFITKVGLIRHLPGQIRLLTETP